MPTYKCDMVFNQGRYGWSESWYKTLSSGEYTQALNATSDLAKLRYKLLGDGVQIEELRVSDVLKTRDSLVSFPQGLFGFNGVLSGNPWDGLLCRLDAGPFHRRGLILRGIPDDWVSFKSVSQLFTDHPLLFSGWVAYRDHLVNSGWQLRVILTEDEAFVASTRTLTLSADLANVAIAAPPAGWKPGTKLRLRAFNTPDPRDKRTVNRVTVIKSIDDDGAAVLSILASDLWGEVEGVEGTVIEQTIGYATLTAGTMERTGHRDTGRAFFVSAGRRRARR